MDVRFPAFRPLSGVTGTGAPAAPGQAAGSGGSFSGALKDALQDVSRLQEDSSALQRRFLAGDESASLERTMMAMQQSQLAFQSAVTVRNRLVSAYTEIMNMPV